MQDRRIDELRHEGPNEYFVYLRIGYRLNDAHCFGEDSLADVKRTMRRVQRCDCPECVKP